MAAINVGDDVLLNALFGGIIGGVGGGLVYRAGGTQGGTSTLGRILQYRFGMSLSSTSLYTDTGVLALAGLVFSVDPNAFVVIGQGHVAYGQGFKKVRLPGALKVES